jgi:hypothetical protein
MDLEQNLNYFELVKGEDRLMIRRYPKDLTLFVRDGEETAIIILPLQSAKMLSEWLAATLKRDD